MLHVPALVVDRAVGEAEAADVAVAVESGQPLVLRRPVIEIALHAIEGALDVRGDLAPDLAVVDVGLEARGTVESGRKQRMTAEIDCHNPLLAQSARPSVAGDSAPSQHRERLRAIA